jgi:superfamily II DNA or RNA helicase
VKRRFGSDERVALFLAAGGKCSLCSIELEPGWHADHIEPYSKGGVTDVINGQATCPPCNLKKGSSVVRAWQQSALQKFASHQAKDFLVAATPGAGKTRFALSAAKDLLDAGSIDRVIVVSPTEHLKTQWAEAAHTHFGIELNPAFINKDGALAKDYHGLIATYAAVASQSNLYRKLTADRRTLVILDEIHHAGDTKSWGESVRNAFEPAVRRLLLSGTPFRSDSNPIPFVTYKKVDDDAPRSCADYSYDYGRAINDGVVRTIAFNALDGQAKWRDAGVVIEGELSNDDPDQAKQALKTALSPNGAWMKSALIKADAALSRVREVAPDLGGLLVARDISTARDYAKLLETICGETPALAVSDEPNSSNIITAFAEATTRWLVAVDMVSEGVDIPRLAVGVYATTKATALFFRQVAGRFVRARDQDDGLCATLFMPSVATLLEHAREIEQERDHALDEAIENSERERLKREQLTLDISVIEPLTSSEAIHRETILSGDSFTDAELSQAEQYGRQVGMPGSIPPVQIARLLRVAGMTSEKVHVEVPFPSVTLVEEKVPLRRLIQKKVHMISLATDKPHGYIYNDLKKMFGDTIPTATIETLEKRLDVLDDWIRTQL